MQLLHTVTDTVRWLFLTLDCLRRCEMLQRASASSHGLVVVWDCNTTATLTAGKQTNPAKTKQSL